MKIAAASTAESIISDICSNTEIDKHNIMSVTIDVLPEEDRQAYEAMCKADKEERRRVECRQAFLSCYTKTRQGVTNKQGIVLPVGAKPKVNAPVSESPLSHDDIANMIDQSLSSKTVNSVQSMMKNV